MLGRAPARQDATETDDERRWVMYDENRDLIIAPRWVEPPDRAMTMDEIERAVTEMEAGVTHRGDPQGPVAVDVTDCPTAVPRTPSRPQQHAGSWGTASSSSARAGRRLGSERRP